MSRHTYCPQVFDHLQVASLQLQKASILSDVRCRSLTLMRTAYDLWQDCFKVYRRAKLLVPRPAESVPPLDGLTFPKGLSAHWIALHQELLTLQESRYKVAHVQARLPPCTNIHLNSRLDFPMSIQYPYFVLPVSR